MKQSIIAVINFAYFTANFPHDFITKCWGEDNYQSVHLKSKLVSNANESGTITREGFLKWFMDLDSSNQEKLALWVEENYSYRGVPFQPAYSKVLDLESEHETLVLN